MPQSTYQGWNTPSGFNFAYATPCNRCRLTACHSIHNHDHAAPSCHLQFCEVCTDLAELDQQIAAVQDQLINLVRKRWVMKSRFNDHHDQLTRHLPMEIVSDIFLFVTASMDPLFDVWFSEYRNCSPFFLGSICKKWRDITLGLPKLWCTLNIKPWNPKFSFNSTKEWLHLSSQSPLSVIYHGDNTSTWGAYSLLPYRKDPHLLNLLRSQATRWKHFTFRGPWKMLHDLLHNIDNVLSINTLNISIYQGTDIPLVIESMEPIQIREPICPKELTTNAVPISKISIQWNNLTHLDASSICLDELLHVIHHATKLTSCIVKYLLENGTNYPLPTTPIVHQAMTFLKLENPIMEYSDPVPYLTLPSLKTFSYQSRLFDSLALDNLIDFLDRSRAPLHTFSFEVDLNHVLIPWYERLSAITHLKIGIYRYREPHNAAEHFFGALAGALNLPHLRELQIFTDDMPKSSWSIFCNIFQATEGEDAIPTIASNGADVSEVTANLCHQRLVGERYKRPLDSVYIQLNYGPQGIQWEGMADEDVFFNLLDIRASGVRLEIMDEYGSDLIECATKLVINRELPFSIERRSRHELPGDEWEAD